MKFAIRLIVLSALWCTSGRTEASDLRAAVLRSQALANGLVPVDQLRPTIDSNKAEAGRLLFKSKLLSMTKEIACQNCHLDNFASADGIPVGIGTKGGDGNGIDRMKHGGDMLPRNTLPFWGRGGIGFNTFFWDGRVDGSIPGKLVSQFGDKPPSSDPLVVAAHLPVVQIKEMVTDGDQFDYLRQESLSAASIVYKEISGRVAADQQLSSAITKAYGISKDRITYLEVAESLAAFIRDRFQLQSTALHDFVFNGGDLSGDAIEGGIIFYGRGKCVSCHSGPYFTDFKFHVLPFRQFGRGMNGFGVDYGRYNVTSNPKDLYKFRTPPLYNVVRTAPYSHSGSEYDLTTAIRSHVDPLAEFDGSGTPLEARTELYQRLAGWSLEHIWGVELNEQDMNQLVAFLNALSFDDKLAE